MMQARQIQIFLRKDERSEGMCGNNNGDKTDDLPSGVTEKGPPPKKLADFLKMASHKTGRLKGDYIKNGCRNALALWVKGFNVCTNKALTD